MRNRLGFIGAGAFSDFCIEAYLKHIPSLEVLGSTDLDSGMNDLFVKRWKLSNKYADIQKLLSDPLINYVAILTPPNTHFELTKTALMHNKNILVEKPIAFLAKDAMELVTISKEKGLKITANLILRHHPHHKMIKKLRESGQYGELIHITTTALLAEYPADHWYWNQEISGGFFLNTYCHFTDLYAYITGLEPEPIGHLGDISNGQVLLLKTGRTHISASIYLHANNQQEEVRTDYIFEKAIIRTSGWFPHKTVIQPAESKKKIMTITDKKSAYQKAIAQVMADLIAKDNGLIGPTDLVRAVSLPLALRNKKL